MDQFKIDNYKKENPRCDFLSYNSLSQEDCENITNKITRLIGSSSSLPKLNQELRSVQHRILGQNVMDESFDFKKILNKFDISIPNKIYIN